MLNIQRCRCTPDATTRQETPPHDRPRNWKAHDRNRERQRESKREQDKDIEGKERERERVIKVHKEYHFNNIKQNLQVGLKWYAWL